MYAFFLDIDGTILKDGQMSPAVADAIRKAQEMGNRVFINTARTYHGIPPVIRHFPFDGFVASYSTTIIAEGGVFHSKAFDRDTLYDFVKYSFDKGLDADFLGEDKFLSVNPSRTPRIAMECAEDIRERYPRAVINKIGVYGPPVEEVVSFFGERSSVYLFPHFFECVPKGYTKATGMEMLCDRFGIPIENSVAIGDTIHDYDMIARAGYGVAMGNGQDELKAKVDYVTDTLANDGVAYAIECILSGEPDKLKKDRDGAEFDTAYAIAEPV